jgi:3-dehydroquinate synthase
MIKKLMGPFKEKIVIVDQLSTKHFDKKHSLLFVDENLKENSEIKNLSKSYKIFWLQAGESLKTIDKLKEVLAQLESYLETLEPPYVFVAVGGGSIGDFCGFLASVYHRGVDFIQCPTTWLAAIDSAHGGKTALNVLNFKNQIGTFYPANQIILSKSLLKQQSPTQAFGEIVKTILLSSPKSSLRQFVNSKLPLDFNVVWNSLTDFITVKNTIVKKDPKEKKGERYKLNLGHTVGHALEKIYGLPHSEAVLRGLIFAVVWSVKKKYSHMKFLSLVLDYVQLHQLNLTSLPRKSAEEFEKAFLKDKKRSGHKINFVFLIKKSGFNLYGSGKNEIS